MSIEVVRKGFGIDEMLETYGSAGESDGSDETYEVETSEVSGFDEPGGGKDDLAEFFGMDAEDKATVVDLEAIGPFGIAVGGTSMDESLVGDDQPGSRGGVDGGREGGEREDRVAPSAEVEGDRGLLSAAEEVGLIVEEGLSGLCEVPHGLAVEGGGVAGMDVSVHEEDAEHSDNGEGEEGYEAPGACGAEGKEEEEDAERNQGDDGGTGEGGDVEWDADNLGEFVGHEGFEQEVQGEEEEEESGQESGCGKAPAKSAEGRTQFGRKRGETMKRPGGDQSEGGVTGEKIVRTRAVREGEGKEDGEDPGEGEEDGTGGAEPAGGFDEEKGPKGEDGDGKLEIEQMKQGRGGAGTRGKGPDTGEALPELEIDGVAELLSAPKEHEEEDGEQGSQKGQESETEVESTCGPSPAPDNEEEGQSDTMKETGMRRREPEAVAEPHGQEEGAAHEDAVDKSPTFGEGPEEEGSPEGDDPGETVSETTGVEQEPVGEEERGSDGGGEEHVGEGHVGELGHVVGGEPKTGGHESDGAAMPASSEGIDEDSSEEGGQDGGETEDEVVVDARKHDDGSGEPDVERGFAVETPHVAAREEPTAAIGGVEDTVDLVGLCMGVRAGRSGGTDGDDDGGEQGDEDAVEDDAMVEVGVSARSVSQ